MVGSGPGFFDVPTNARYALRDVRLPASVLLNGGKNIGDYQSADMLIENGIIVAVEPVGTFPDSLGPDLRSSMVLPCLIDCHAHLDKAHIATRAPNSVGDIPGALEVAAKDREQNWSADDVRKRMEFGLRIAYAHGVRAIRTHLDSQGPQAGISFGVFREMRERWAGRVEVQASSLVALDVFLREDGRSLADGVAASGGNLGCATRLAGHEEKFSGEVFDKALGNLFDLAMERNLDLDLHVDETEDPSARTLAAVARMAREKDFGGRILCGHCCSLAKQSDAIVEETILAVREAGISIVSLPLANMHLQDRHPSRTPRWRGVTLLKELKAAGVPVAIGGDNVRDPFYPYGDHDMLDTFSQAVKILHLDHPFADWLQSASVAPAEIMGLRVKGMIGVGEPADMIVIKARDICELIARPQFDRVVIRNGRQISTTLPDYRELD